MCTALTGSTRVERCLCRWHRACSTLDVKHMLTIELCAQEVTFADLTELPQKQILEDVGPYALLRVSTSYRDIVLHHVTCARIKDDASELLQRCASLKTVTLESCRPGVSTSHRIWTCRVSSAAVPRSLMNLGCGTSGTRDNGNTASSRTRSLSYMSPRKRCPVHRESSLCARKRLPC